MLGRGLQAISPSPDKSKSRAAAKGGSRRGEASRRSVVPAGTALREPSGGAGARGNEYVIVLPGGHVQPASCEPAKAPCSGKATTTARQRRRRERKRSWGKRGREIGTGCGAVCQRLPGADRRRPLPGPDRRRTRCGAVCQRMSTPPAQGRGRRSGKRTKLIVNTSKLQTTIGSRTRS